MADTQLYLGLDLGPEYTQLSYYNADTREPESVYHEEAKDTYMLPNIMFYSAYHKRMGDNQNDCYKFIDLSGWCVGARASAYRFEDKGTVVDGIYESTLKNENIEVEGRGYKASDLMVKMLVLHIKQFTDTLGGFVIKRLTVTVADTDPRIIQAVRGLKTALRLSHDQFNIVSHLDSGLCYIFAQPEPLRNNSVGLFDFGRAGLDFYRIDMTRKYPLIVTTQHINYHDKMNLRRFGRYHEDMDETFADIVKECTEQVFISSVFLTGLGFSENWMKQSATVLCQGRRVFVGQNIYTKGACYRSLGGVYTESLSRYFIDTEQTVKTNIGINLMDEKNTFWPIVYGGLEWFNTRGRVVVFLDDTRRIQIVYQDILTEEEYIETIEIYGLPARPPKTTKLSIEVEYYGADKGAIVIRDMGFGNLYPTTNKIYRKEFDISEIKKKHAKKIEHERIKAAEGDTEELIGEDPVDRDAEAERERQERIQAEELAAQDALKHEIHMDLDDLRYRAENDSDNTEDVVYYGTASPEPEGEEVDVDIADTEAEVTDSDMSAPVGETAGIDEQESEREAADIDEQESEREAADIDEQESEREAADSDEMKLEDEAADGDEQETERAKEKDEAVESELADEDIPETEPASAYVYNAGDVKEDVGDVAESDETEDEDIDVYGMKIHDDDDEDYLDSDEDEPEQSRFTIPAYLRGQHFDPGE
ncbi:hypothetical protein DWX94_02815 [Coprococcus eutactus]|uniref:DUF5716 domain-containing protein n=1 Tax=Coprococcus eutactus TaxID=33043 RepID=A0A3R5YV74_9FIRM|nr:hypothetical protein DWX94_02815 [Coprococcus eutactus]